MSNMKVKVMKTVLRTGEPRIISKDLLDSLIDICVKNLYKKDKDISDNKVKEVIYHNLLSDLKRNNYFYPGLTFTYVWGVVKSKIKNKEINDVDPNKLEEEYDEICLKKANGLPFSEEKLKFISNLLNNDRRK